MCPKIIRNWIRTTNWRHTIKKLIVFSYGEKFVLITKTFSLVMQVVGITNLPNPKSNVIRRHKNVVIKSNLHQVFYSINLINLIYDFYTWKLHIIINHFDRVWNHGNTGLSIKRSRRTRKWYTTWPRIPASSKSMYIISFQRKKYLSHKFVLLNCYCYL